MTDYSYSAGELVFCYQIGWVSYRSCIYKSASCNCNFHFLIDQEMGIKASNIFCAFTSWVCWSLGFRRPFACWNTFRNFTFLIVSCAYEWALTTRKHKYSCNELLFHGLKKNLFLNQRMEGTLIVGIFYGNPMGWKNTLWKIEIVPHILEMHLQMHHEPTLWRTKWVSLLINTKKYSEDAFPSIFNKYIHSWSNSGHFRDASSEVWGGILKFLWPLHVRCIRKCISEMIW